MSTTFTLDTATSRAAAPRRAALASPSRLREGAGGWARSPPPDEDKPTPSPSRKREGTGYSVNAE